MRAALLLALAAGGPGALRAQQGTDSLVGGLPTGRGRLRLDDITLTWTSGTLQIRLTPLDERVLRLLAPDGYAAMRAQLQAVQPRIDTIAMMAGVREPGVALVVFHAVAPGTRFDPRLLNLTVRGQQLRPIGTIPLSGAFSNQQLDVRDQAIGLVLFSQPIPVTEAFGASYAGSSNNSWDQRLTRFDAERTRIIGHPPMVSDTGGAGPRW
jgi:hypothetical protein